MLQTGESLAGYRIESIAGIGGMGVVYRATQLSLDRPVALKVLSSTLVGNRAFRERFRREGRHAAALEHPNIIPVYEAGESNGLMFIAMRLIDGPTLADVMHRHEVSGRETLRVLAAIASALDAAHDAGLVHRDVKPQNILLTSAGHPYLADFGITKGTQSGGLTRTGDFVGSLSYVSPEQMEGTEVGPATDIYSLAAVLFQCLTGALPYERDTEAALMHAHLFSPPPTIADVGADAPAALDDVFLRGMAKTPGDRYETAGDMVAACAAILDMMPAEVLDRAPAFPAPASTEDAAPALEPDGWEPRSEVAAAAIPVSSVDLAPGGGDGQLTAADRKRGGSEREPVVEPRVARPHRHRTAALVAAGVALLAAPIAGYALGSGDDAPSRASASSAAVRVDHGTDWRAAQTSFAGLSLSGKVGLLHDRGAVLTAGRVVDPASGMDPTNSTLRDAFVDANAGTPVKIGSRTLLRYAGRQRAGGSAWVVLAPDSKGWTAVGCRTAAVDTSLEKLCGQVASTLTTPGAEPVALGPDRALASTLDKAIKALGATRSERLADLSSSSVKKRSAASEDLAKAHAEAATSIAKVKLRPQDKALVERVTDALESQSEAFKKLGTAAGAKDRDKYNLAREAVASNERELKAALAAMKRGGYVVKS